MTPKQLDCLHFIRDYTAEHGVAPTYDEIASALNLSTRSRVHVVVSSLKAKGFVEYEPRQARSIRLTDLKSKVDFLCVVYGRDAVENALSQSNGREAA